MFESWPLHSNLQILKLFTTNDPYLRVIVSFGVHDISPLLSGIILTGKLIDSIHKLTGENIEQVLQHFVNEITLLFERDVDVRALSAAGSRWPPKCIGSMIRLSRVFIYDPNMIQDDNIRLSLNLLSDLS